MCDGWLSVVLLLVGKVVVRVLQDERRARFRDEVVSLYGSGTENESFIHGSLVVSYRIMKWGRTVPRRMIRYDTSLG